MIIPGCTTTTTVTNGIPNLSQVEPGIWRGGQPTPEGWDWLQDRDWLQDQGVTCVVKLNSWNESSDSTAIIKGMTVHTHAISLLEQLVTRPKLSRVQEAVEAIQNGAFVHCEHGWDRTGLIVACYRMTQGWSKADAEHEMMDRGFHLEMQGLLGFWEMQRQEDWWKR